MDRRDFTTVLSSDRRIHQGQCRYRLVVVGSPFFNFTLITFPQPSELKGIKQCNLKSYLPFFPFLAVRSLRLPHIHPESKWRNEKKERERDLSPYSILWRLFPAAIYKRCIYIKKISYWGERAAVSNPLSQSVTNASSRPLFFLWVVVVAGRLIIITENAKQAPSCVNGGFDIHLVIWKECFLSL